jgi:hypothetical protein
MRNIRKTLLMLGIALMCCIYSSTAQIVVRVKPDRPHYERPVAPGPRHVWIDEEWEPRNGAYVFVGGRWAEPPREHGRWIPGHWKDTPGGVVWKPGHWRY